MPLILRAAVGKKASGRIHKDTFVRSLGRTNYCLDHRYLFVDGIEHGTVRSEPIIGTAQHSRSPSSSSPPPSNSIQSLISCTVPGSGEGIGHQNPPLLFPVVLLVTHMDFWPRVSELAASGRKGNHLELRSSATCRGVPLAFTY